MNYWQKIRKGFAAACLGFHKPVIGEHFRCSFGARIPTYQHLSKHVGLPSTECVWVSHARLSEYLRGGQRVSIPHRERLRRIAKEIGIPLVDDKLPGKYSNHPETAAAADRLRGRFERDMGDKYADGGSGQRGHFF